MIVPQKKQLSFWIPFHNLNFSLLLSASDFTLSVIHRTVFSNSISLKFYSSASSSVPAILSPTATSVALSSKAFKNHLVILCTAIYNRHTAMLCHPQAAHNTYVKWSRNYKCSQDTKRFLSSGGDVFRRGRWCNC